MQSIVWYGVSARAGNAAMVRSIARGQFRVTGAWQELSPVPADEPTTTPDDPAPAPGIPTIELTVEEPRAEESPAPEGPLALETIGPPALLGAHELALTAPTPVLELLPPVPRVEVVPAPPLQVAEPVVEAPPEPETLGPGDAGRTLAALLARMWLLRSATGAGTGVALPASVPLGVPTPAARGPIGPAPLNRGGVLVEPLLLHAPDEDDRRPTSGLASFLVEVANATSPPAGTAVEAHPPVAPLGPEKFRVVLRFAHCPQPIPDRPASRDGCALARYARVPIVDPAVSGGYAVRDD